MRGALQAMKNLDGEMKASYFVEDMREELEQELAFFSSVGDEIRIRNIETSLVSAPANSATASACQKADAHPIPSSPVVGATCRSPTGRGGGT